jgi:hypothetical protein
MDEEQAARAAAEAETLARYVVTAADAARFGFSAAEITSYKVS